MADLVPLTPGQIQEVYDRLAVYGNKTFPNKAKFLEVLNGYWNMVLRDQLAAARLVKGSVGGRPNFEVLRDAVVAQWIRSRAQPGFSVGSLAADALGQPVMQAVLKTFHFAGLNKAGFGSDTAMELVSLSPERQSQNARIHLRRDLSFDEAYQYLQDHRIAKIKDLILDREYDVVVRGSHEWEPWFSGAVAGKPVPFPEDWSAGLKLNLDPTTLHQFRLTPTRVAAIIERAFNVAQQELYCVGSPVRAYCVYVLAYKGVVLQRESALLTGLIKGLAEENVEAKRRLDDALLEMAFFQHLAYARIINIDLPGDRYISAGISDTGIAPAPVLALVLKETPLGELRGRARFSWRINKLAIRDGITPYRLGRLLRAAGFAVVSARYFRVSPDQSRSLEMDGFVVRPADGTWLDAPDAHGMPAWLYHFRGGEDWRRLVSIEVLAPSGAGRPGEIFSALDWLKRRVAADEKALQEADARSELLQELPFVRGRVVADGAERGLLSELSQHWYFAASQPNIQTLLRHQDVDPRFTTTNQFKLSKGKVAGIAETLGIVALRNHIIDEFYETIVGGGGDIDPQHVVLVADYMIYQGRPIPLTSGGYAKREISTNDEAYIDKATGRYLATAAIGKMERVETIASSIALGRPVPLGTGLVEAALVGVAAEAPSLAPAPESAKYQRIDSVLESLEARTKAREDTKAAVAAINRYFTGLLATTPATTPAAAPPEEPAVSVPVMTFATPPAAPAPLLNRRSMEALRRAMAPPPPGRI